MIIGIDASNIRAGGGVTHLIELFNDFDPGKFEIEKIILWSSSDVISLIPKNDFIELKSDSFLNKNLLYREYWSRFRLPVLLKKHSCDLLFSPGGRVNVRNIPSVVMIQNLLPFEWKELLRYGLSLIALRLILLRFLQLESIKKANGIIFLSNYSKKIVCRITDNEISKSTIVPHGVNPNFFNDTRITRKPSEFSFNNPCKIVYTSSIDPYKHQVNVILAVAKIRSSGVFINLDLIGPSNVSSKKKLITIIGQVDPFGEYIRYLGNVNYNELNKLYKSYDMAVFASSCETFGMILLEKMASGLPVACSHMSSMSEILGNSGIYFDPLNILDIEQKITILILSKVKRNNFSRNAYLNAKQYSWERSSMDTFSFLTAVYKGRVS